MDLIKLKKATDLLDKSKATEIVMNVVKNTQENDLDISMFKEPEFFKALYLIRQDFYRKLIELKSEYDKEFSAI